MDTALPQKFPVILNRNLAKANCTENHVCTSCDTVVLAYYIIFSRPIIQLLNFLRSGAGHHPSVCGYPLVPQQPPDVFLGCGLGVRVPIEGVDTQHQFLGVRQQGNSLTKIPLKERTVARNERSRRKYLRGKEIQRKQRLIERY